MQTELDLIIQDSLGAELVITPNGKKEYLKGAQHPVCLIIDGKAVELSRKETKQAIKSLKKLLKVSKL